MRIVIPCRRTRETTLAKHRSLSQENCALVLMKKIINIKLSLMAEIRKLRAKLSMHSP